MSHERIVRRYSAYYVGWCVAFGTHDIPPEEGGEIHWIFGDNKVGITLSTRLKKVFIRELLGRFGDIPRLTLGLSSMWVNDFEYPIGDSRERASFDRFKAFFHATDEAHMFLTSHFCYPQGTRIVTFDHRKPLVIIYKEIQPLRLSLV
jgi:hypothetical protein